MEQNKSPKTIIIKFGGGLITQKSILKTPNMDNLRSLATAVKELSNSYNIVVVHGAGSYGHLYAKKYKLHLGNDDEFGTLDGFSQLDAVKIVRDDMIELSDLVSKVLAEQGLECYKIPPHKFITGTSLDFEIDIQNIQDNIHGKIPLLWGDVVTRKGALMFGILSGDDIAARLAMELNDVQSLVFAMGGADGVMTKPPDHPDSKLIRTWNKDTFFNALHNTDEDVTGGILYKVSRGSQISPHVKFVYIVNGEYPDRVISAANGDETVGTRIIPN